ncbi:MAG: hypothetical protein ACERKO_03725 [Acetanaerobacterium sp.]
MDSIVGFNLRLMTGFFKTEQYFIWVYGDMIGLHPQDSTNRTIVIPHSKLRSISLCIQLREMEIIACDEVFVGRLSAECNIEVVLAVLASVFGAQLVLESYQFGADSL